jgi:dCTP deaminase
VSILVDRDILAAMKAGSILIDPFDQRALGTNSYDVHLSPKVQTYVDKYDRTGHELLPLDVRTPNDVQDHRISDEGCVLVPGTLYLCSTIEYTESHAHIPFLEGKSSLGRLGMSIHVTAGKGDVGFCNHWTMEVTVIRPLRVFAGMPVGQLIWHEASNEPTVPYNRKPSAKYVDRSAGPQASAMWKNFNPSVGKP